MATVTKPNGTIIYEGPSLIDGSPIVAIVTGIRRKSQNVKTGDMLQTWILRSDIDPKTAANNGADVAICGTCPRRRDAKGKRRCYVTVGRAPLTVYKAYKRGRYSADGTTFDGRKLRLGAYGDPAAVPFDVWETALVGTVGHTGYTHQWHTADRRFATIVMASIDFSWQVRHAEMRGYRKFRVNNANDVGERESPRREIACPASVERGHVTNCDTCLACSGTSNPRRQFDVVINEH